MPPLLLKAALSSWYFFKAATLSVPGFDGVGIPWLGVVSAGARSFSFAAAAVSSGILLLRRRSVIAPEPLMCGNSPTMAISAQSGAAVVGSGDASLASRKISESLNER